MMDRKVWLSNDHSTKLEPFPHSCTQPGHIKKPHFPSISAFPGHLKETFPARRESVSASNLAALAPLKVQIGNPHAGIVFPLDIPPRDRAQRNAVPRCNVSRPWCSSALVLIYQPLVILLRCRREGHDSTDYTASLIRFLTQVSDVRIQLPNEAFRWGGLAFSISVRSAERATCQARLSRAGSLRILLPMLSRLQLIARGNNCWEFAYLRRLWAIGKAVFGSDSIANVP